MSEAESRKAAFEELRRLGLSEVDAGRVLDAVRAQKWLMSRTPGGYIQVEYKDGEYVITL